MLVPGDRTMAVFIEFPEYAEPMSTFCHYFFLYYQLFSYKKNVSHVHTEGCED
jgi:hypothetical protein